MNKEEGFVFEWDEKHTHGYVSSYGVVHLYFKPSPLIMGMQIYDAEGGRVVTNKWMGTERHVKNVADFAALVSASDAGTFRLQERCAERVYEMGYNMLGKLQCSTQAAHRYGITISDDHWFNEIKPELLRVINKK